MAAGWRPGRAYLTWHVLVTDPAPFAPWRELVGTFPAHAVVAPEGLHLTLQGVGFADEVTGPALDAAVTAVRRRVEGLPAFGLALPRVHVGRGGTSLAADPADGDGPRTLRRLVRDGLRDAGLVPPGDDDEVLHPHVSLAYATGAVPRGPLEELVVAGRPPVPVLDVDAVTLLALRMDPPRYVWDVVAVAPLGRA